MNATVKRIIYALSNRVLKWTSRGWVRCNIPKTSTILEFVVIDNKSLIGRYTFINRFCEITRATIGNYCSIGSGVRIGAGEHNFSLLATSSFITGHNAEDLTVKPCKIGHDVWIGTQAFVKRGVTIGNGAVVGAYAVVTKDVPDFAIVVGSPAKVIRYRFPEETRKKILFSGWWNKDLEYAKEAIDKL